MSDVNWNQFEYFITLAEIQNYTKAADMLCISQPALSKAISNLEKALGVALFQKKGRGVELNYYGKIFLEHLYIARKEINLGQYKIQTLSSPTTGHIRLASLYTIGINLMPHLIKDFSSEWPDVTFTFHQQPTRIMLEMLRNNEIDLCFCTDFTGYDEEREFMKSIISIEDLYILVPIDHPLAQRDKVDLIELKDDLFIFYSNETLFKGPALKLMESAGFEPKIIYEANEDATVASFVANGLGVALIPPISNLDLTKCVPLKIGSPIAQRTLSMAWRKDSYMIPIVNKFRDYVIRWLPEHQHITRQHLYL